MSENHYFPKSSEISSNLSNQAADVTMRAEVWTASTHLLRPRLLPTLLKIHAVNQSRQREWGEATYVVFLANCLWSFSPENLRGREGN